MREREAVCVSTDVTYSMIVILIVILVTVILIVIIVVVIVMIITIMIVLGIETVYGLVIKTGCGYPSAAVHARVSSALTRHMPLQAFCGERASWRNGLLSCLLLLASRVTCRF